MPTLTIKGSGAYEVESGHRLVLAIERCGVDIGHRCGGYARCTTCRVRFDDGEPQKMTRAEYDKLAERGLLGEVRLSCQLVVEGDMTVEPLMRVAEMGWSDPGPPPASTVTPEATWLEREALE
ncbi:MAG: 2Fe-2S iron-sulfur cluster-binding protein [Rhodothermales bacterium]